MTETAQRDGFVIKSRETGEEVEFIACSYDARMRERVEVGLLMRIDVERFYFEDTREQ